MKTGLVLEGGGMRGIYTVGALDVFMDNQIRFDYVIGVSAGQCRFVYFGTARTRIPCRYRLCA